MDLIMQIRDSSLFGQGNEQKMLLLYYHHHFCALACITTAVQLVVSIHGLPREEEAKRASLKMGLRGAVLTNVLQSFIGHFSLLNCQLSVPKDV